MFPGGEPQELLTSTSRKRRAVSPPLSSPTLFVETPPPIAPVPPVALSARPEIHGQPIGPILPIKNYTQKQDSSRSFPGNEHVSFDSVALEPPFRRYKPILTEDQAGMITVAHSINSAFDVVAIRKRSVPYRKGSVLRCSQKNLVALKEAFYYEDCFYFVYEPMAVSLAALQCVPGDDFVAYEISAVAKEVCTPLLIAIYC